MHAPSTRDTELEAIAWAELGLARARGVLHGHRIMGTSAFTQSWPDLCASRVHEFRTDMPDPWRLALQRGRATQPGEEYIPRGLLDIDEKPASGDTQRLALLYAPTLVRRTATPLAAVKAQHVYAAGMAAAFTLPRVLDISSTAPGRQPRGTSTSSSTFHSHTTPGGSPQGRQRGASTTRRCREK